MLAYLKPKTLFGRMLAIILIPLILVQVITVLVFYGRHWDNITRYMAANLAADITVVVDQVSASPSAETLRDANYFAQSYFLFKTRWEPGGIVQPHSDQVTSTYAGRQLKLSIEQKLDLPFRMNLDDSADFITISVQYPEVFFILMLAGNGFSARHHGCSSSGQSARPLFLRWLLFCSYAGKSVLSAD